MDDEPQGIVDVDETMLNKGESLNLSLRQSNTPIWLMRLPPDLSKIWKVQHQYQGQTVAQMKIPTNGSNNKIIFQVAPELARKSEFDSSYEVKLTKNEVNNEYVFTEAEYTQFKEEKNDESEHGSEKQSDQKQQQQQQQQQRSSPFMTQVAALPQQPKMKSLNKEAIYHEAKWTRKVKETEDPNAIHPASGMGTTDLNKNARRGRWSKRGFIPFARTIPKKTEFIGKIVHECQVVPLRLAVNDKLRLQAQRRHLKSLVKKSTIKVIDNKEVGKMHGKSTPNIQTGATMIMSKVEQMKKQGQKEEGRHARMDKRELMAKIFDCFKQFEYWSIKNLKAKLKQPEQWLRENLEEVAAMEKGGTFTQKWRLKEEYRRTIQAQNKGFDDNEIDEDDEDENQNIEEEDDEEDSDMDLEDVAAI